MPKSLSYYDPRHADTYVIELEDDGSFAYANRYVVEVGRAPITYEHLADIPLVHRAKIEEEIFKAKNKTI